MWMLIYSTVTADRVTDLHRLVEYAGSHIFEAYVKGIWIDERDDTSILRRQGGVDVLRHARRGDHLIVPDVGTLAHPIRDLRHAIRQLVEVRGLTLHFVSEEFVFGPAGDARRMNELVEAAHRNWRIRRTREGVADWKAHGSGVTGWAPYGERIVFRNGERTTEGCWSERRWIAKILEWREAGSTYSQIVAQLKRRKAQTSRGTAWKCDRVRRVILADRAAKARVSGSIGASEHDGVTSAQPLCEPKGMAKRVRKRTSNKPHVFEVAGIRVKKYPATMRTISETRRAYREVMRTMKLFCRSADRYRSAYKSASSAP
jgi:hypothetical protein